MTKGVSFVLLVAFGFLQASYAAENTVVTAEDKSAAMKSIEKSEKSKAADKKKAKQRASKDASSRNNDSYVWGGGKSKDKEKEKK